MLVAAVALVVGATACGSSGKTQSVAGYCAKAKALDGATDRLGHIDLSDKAAVKSMLAGIQADAHSALKQAPVAVRGDAGVVVGDIDDLVTVVSKAGYDVKKVSRQDFDRISNQGVDAQTRVTDYNQKTCGILPAEPTTRAPGQPATTSTTGVGGG